MSSSLWSCGYQVRISDGPDKGRTFPLDAVEVTVGRARHAGDRAPGWILLNDPKVSRIHLDLLWNEGKKTFQLCPKSETNHTFVNGAPLALGSVTDLKVGDLIRFGASEIDYQQADFRFGGVDPMAATALTAQSRQNRAATTAVPSLKAHDSRLDNEKSSSTKVAPRRAALTLRPNFELAIVQGPGKGKSLPITGMRLALGGPRLDPYAPPPKHKDWDQEISLEDPALPEHFLSLTWRELHSAFELNRYANQLEIPVQLARWTDGLAWSGELSTTAPAMLRDGDSFVIGNVALMLHVPREDG
jgi:pSer/pThr/pTyr-binding forkhead associated (FHA) protein